PRASHLRHSRSSPLSLLPQPPPISTLFPYTTLFRSFGINENVALRVAAVREVRDSFTTNTGTSPSDPGNTDFTGARANLSLRGLDRKSTRLNSSHVKISYAVFCLKKKNELTNRNTET